MDMSKSKYVDDNWDVVWQDEVVVIGGKYPTLLSDKNSKPKILDKLCLKFHFMTGFLLQKYMQHWWKNGFFWWPYVVLFNKISSMQRDIPSPSRFDWGKMDGLVYNGRLIEGKQ